VSEVIGLHYYTHDWLKKLPSLFHPIRSKTKTNRDSRAHTFSRASHQLHLFTSSFDWFIGLSVSFVIGYSDNVGFGFPSLNSIENRSNAIRLNETSYLMIFTQCRFIFFLTAMMKRRQEL